MLECVRTKFVSHFIEKFQEHRQSVYDRSSIKPESIYVNIEFFNENDEAINTSDGSNGTVENDLSSTNCESVSSLDQNTVGAEFNFIENELYTFLNNEDNIDGRLILNIYKRTRELETERLIDMVLLQAIKKDKYKWLKTGQQFEDIRDLIVELFPTEDGDVYYVGHEKATEFSDTLHAHDGGKNYASRKAFNDYTKRAGCTENHHYIARKGVLRLTIFCYQTQSWKAAKVKVLFQGNSAKLKFTRVHQIDWKLDALSLFLRCTYYICVRLIYFLTCHQFTWLGIIYGYDIVRAAGAATARGAPITHDTNNLYILEKTTLAMRKQFSVRAVGGAPASPSEKRLARIINDYYHCD
uniref:Uncharacterized protein n=1 Tax=Trichogramma kaykai TaxID=54128 RepID=A0ABD2WRC9_9HYME